MSDANAFAFGKFIPGFDFLQQLSSAQKAGGGSLPGLFSGALITETLFSIPGIGYISYQSMVAGDIPFTMFYLSFMAVLTLVSNLLTDIMYAVVDPRVRIS